MNVSTAIVLAVVIACACLAVRSFRKKGMCGCKDCHSCSGGCASCSSCAISEEGMGKIDEAVRRLDVS